MLFYQIVMVSILIGSIGIVSYFVSVNLMVRDVKSLDYELVNVMNRSFDEMVTSFKRFFNYVTMNEEIQIQLKQPYNSTDSTEFHEINGRLSKLLLEQTIFIDEIHSCYLFDDRQNLRAGFKRKYIRHEPEVIYPVVDPADFSGFGDVTMEQQDGFLLFKRKILDMQDHQGIGYLVVVYDKARIQQQMDIVNPNEYRNIILLDETGSTIASNNKDQTNTQSILHSLPTDLVNDVIELPGYGKSVVTTSNSNLTKWSIISITSVYHLSQSSRIISWVTLRIGIIGLSAAAVTIVIFTSHLLTPISELTSVVRAMQQNNNFSQRFEPVKDDEIGILGKSFNHLMQQVEDLITEVYDEELRRKDAQLQALQAQINPHFLYNTLDCINWLAEFGRTQDIKTVSMAFANIMKMSAKDQKLVTVEEEMHYVRDFLAIYRITLQDRLQCDISVAPELLELHLPKLILQPLVENAVIHGIKKRAGLGTLRINGMIRGESVVFQIIDNGMGFRPEHVAEIRRYIQALHDKAALDALCGIGIKNVLDRLEIFYGRHFTFTVESNESMGSLVEISIEAAALLHRQETRHEPIQHHHSGR